MYKAVIANNADTTLTINIKINGIVMKKITTIPNSQQLVEIKVKVIFPSDIQMLIVFEYFLFLFDFTDTE